MNHVTLSKNFIILKRLHIFNLVLQIHSYKLKKYYYEGNEKLLTVLNSLLADELTVINQYVDQITVASSPTQNINNVRRYIFDYIYGNYQYKDSILNADKVAFQKANHEYSDLYYQTLWDQTRAMTNRLIAGSSKSLAELIITA